MSVASSGSRKVRESSGAGGNVASSLENSKMELHFTTRAKWGGGEGRAGPRQDQALHLVHRSRDGRKQSSPGWRSRQRCLPNGPHLVIGS